MIRLCLLPLLLTACTFETGGLEDLVDDEALFVSVRCPSDSETLELPRNGETVELRRGWQCDIGETTTCYTETETREFECWEDGRYEFVGDCTIVVQCKSLL